jgi:hypothetical protein
MTFKEQPANNEEIGHANDNPAVKSDLTKGAASEKPNDPNKESDTPIGLSGGQPKEKGGLDISHYTGPDSRTTSQLKVEEEPNKSGPGSGKPANPASLPQTNEE